METVRLRTPLTVWVYPANSFEEGAIEERQIIEIQEDKVKYDKPDQYGYVGFRKENVFFTESQAKLRQLLDKFGLQLAQERR